MINKNRVDILQKSNDEIEVKFLTIINQILNKEKYAFIFEGEDEKYYTVRINRYIENNHWISVVCGGKENVLKVYEALKTNKSYKNSRFACFVDKDFGLDIDFEKSSLIDNQINHLYITPTYSIENLYTSISSFKQILSSEFQIKEYEDYENNQNDFEKCVKYYQQTLNDFLECVQYFNYFFKAHQMMFNDQKTKVKLNINNIKISDIAEIKIGSATIKYEKYNVHSLFKDLPNDFKIDENLMNEIILSFPRENWERDFRGKQQLEFLQKFLTLLKNDRTSKKPEFFTKKGNVELNPNENCISTLSSYAETPDCLKKFLQAFSELSVNKIKNRSEQSM